ETLTTGVGEHALGTGPAPAPARWWSGELAAGWVSQFGQAKLAAAIGWRLDRFHVEAGLALRASLPNASGMSPSLELSELRAGGFGRFAMPLADFEVGASLALDLDRIHAVGIAVGGERADLARYTPLVRALADGVWR